MFRGWAAAAIPLKKKGAAKRSLTASRPASEKRAESDRKHQQTPAHTAKDPVVPNRGFPFPKHPTGFPVSKVKDVANCSRNSFPNSTRFKSGKFQPGPMETRLTCAQIGGPLRARLQQTPLLGNSWFHP